MENLHLEPTPLAGNLTVALCPEQSLYSFPLERQTKRDIIILRDECRTLEKADDVTDRVLECLN